MSSSPRGAARAASSRVLRSRRVLITGTALAVGLVLAGLAFLRLQPWSTPEPTGPDPTASAPVASGATPPQASPTEPVAVDMDALYDPVTGCEASSVVPLGQAPDAVGFEPLGSIWCFALDDPPVRTAVEGPNSWVDDFDVCDALPCHTMARFDDGDLGYRVFNEAGQDPGRAQHFLNQNHWMVDATGAFQGGATMRPDRSFRFEDGSFVVEAEVAAAIPEYGDSGDTWVELTVTTAPEPTSEGPFPDALYAYGQFPGHQAVGCRLQASRVPVCAVYGPGGTPGDGLCQETGARLLEISFWQHCGESFGGGPFTSPAHLQDAWRACDRAGMDMDCRDQFRMELTRDSLSLYVNGELYFRDAGWPASHQLDDSLVHGDVYVYQSNWQVRNGDDFADPDDGSTYRYHWDRFAINPPAGATAAPTPRS